MNMDKATIVGILALIVLVVGSYLSGVIPPVLFNSHAFIVVLGGTIVATLISSPSRYFIKAIKGIFIIFKEGGYSDFDKIMNYVTEIGDNVRKNGFKALKDVDEKIADGFIKRVSECIVEYSDMQFVRSVIEKEINYEYDEMIEISNVYRTMSVLSPMFGLVGTLIGIIGVLKEISNPDMIGPAMSIAITSAFYGIFLSNMIFTPFANKIRTRAVLNLRFKGAIFEVMLDIMKGTLSVMIERKLKIFK